VPDRTTGQLRLLYNGHLDAGSVTVRLLTSNIDLVTNTRFRYEVLEKNGFDPSRWPSDMFCPSAVKHHPGLEDLDYFANQATRFENGIPLPVLTAQVTLIPGGLVLSVWTHHCIADGAGARRIYSIWSDNVRQSASFDETIELDQVTEPERGSAEVDSSAVPRALDTLAHTLTPEPQTTILDHRVQPLRAAYYPVAAKLFRFHPTTIDRLRNSLTNLTNIRLSIFVTIAALLWTYILRAQKTVLVSTGSTTSTLAVVVDLRSRLKALFDTTQDYLGNCVLNVKPTYALPDAIETFHPTRRLSV
jgi:hypothetical protein